MPRRKKSLRRKSMKRRRTTKRKDTKRIKYNTKKNTKRRRTYKRKNKKKSTMKGGDTMYTGPLFKHFSDEGAANLIGKKDEIGVAPELSEADQIKRDRMRDIKKTNENLLNSLENREEELKQEAEVMKMKRTIYNKKILDLGEEIDAIERKTYINLKVFGRMILGGELPDKLGLDKTHESVYIYKLVWDYGTFYFRHSDGQHTGKVIEKSMFIGGTLTELSTTFGDAPLPHRRRGWTNRETVLNENGAWLLDAMTEFLSYLKITNIRNDFTNTKAGPIYEHANVKMFIDYCSTGKFPTDHEVNPYGSF